MNHWVCPECGPHATSDEDGCCVLCGEDLSNEPCICMEWEDRWGKLKARITRALRDLDKFSFPTHLAQAATLRHVLEWMALGEGTKK